MKFRLSAVAWVIVFVVAWTLIPRPSWTAAQDAAATDAAIPPMQVVGLANGQVGFFDPSAKRLYVYGPDLRMALQVVEIGQPGQPLRLIQRSGR